MDDQIRELAAIAAAITEGFKMVAQEIRDVAQEIGEQQNALLEISEVLTSIREEYKRGDKDDKTATLDGGRTEEGETGEET